MRAGIRSLLADEKDRKNLSGQVHAVLLAMHDEKSDNEVTEMGHAFDRIIGTHIHSKIEGDRCLEIFILKGDAPEVNDMVKRFRTNKKMDHIRLIAM